MEKDLEDIKQLTLALEQRRNAEESDICSDDDEEEYDFMEFFEEQYDPPSINIEVEGVIQENTANYYETLQTYLSNDELNEIDSCPNPGVKQAMILNRMKSCKLKNSLMHFSTLLQKCTMEIEKLNEPQKQTRLQLLNFKALMFGYPYFKLLKGMIGPNKDCPPNIELVQKLQNNELTPVYYNSITPWSICDQKMLLFAIKDYYKKFMGRQEGDYPIEDSNDLNWNLIGADLAKRHPPLSCKHLWEIYLHPDINNGIYDKNECINLKRIAEANKLQDWETIAKELNTKRSAFSVCIQYFTKIDDKLLKTKFSAEDDKKLLAIVDKHRIGDYIPWNKVQEDYCERGRLQLYHRYYNIFRIKDCIKGPFSPAEDILVLILHGKYGYNYLKYLKHINNRSTEQIKFRLTTYLLKDHIQLGNWTVKEDTILLDYLKEHGLQNLQVLEGKLARTKNHIYGRYKIIKKFLLANPGKSLKDLPRRKHDFLKSRRPHRNLLKTIANQFKLRIPTLDEIEAVLSNQDNGKYPKNFEVVDTQILEYFKSTNAIKHNKTGLQGDITNLPENYDIVKRLLNMFGAKLSIPEHFHPTGLDDIDIEILEQLRKEPATHEINLKKWKDCLVPPNVETMAVLRSLLIQFKTYQDSFEHSKEHNVMLGDMEALLRNDSCRAFYERFYQTFRWPCIMSLLEPNSSLEESDTDSVPEDGKAGAKHSKKMGAKELKRMRLEKVQRMNAVRINKGTASTSAFEDESMDEDDPDKV